VRDYAPNPGVIPHDDPSRLITARSEHRGPPVLAPLIEWLPGADHPNTFRPQDK
jgi:hypothetical protein